MRSMSAMVFHWASAPAVMSERRTSLDLRRTRGWPPAAEAARRSDLVRGGGWGGRGGGGGKGGGRGSGQGGHSEVRGVGAKGRSDVGGRASLGCCGARRVNPEEAAWAVLGRGSRRAVRVRVFIGGR